MPTFNYQCTACGCEYEELIMAHEEARCPNCDPDGDFGIKQKRLIPAPSIFDSALTDGMSSIKGDD